MKKRLLSLVLTLSLVITLGVTPVYAAFATATTIALEDYSGEVSVSNSLGLPLVTSWVSTLYNGYTVVTDGGYAWILLDDTQLIKMNNDTKVTLKKTNNQTEVLVDRGEVLFVVTETLEASASLTIRTSTLSAGVRGTSGLVTVTQPEKETTQRSYLSMYEGAVQVSTAVETKTAIDTYTVTAGQLLSVQEDGTNLGTIIAEYIETDVAEELADSGFVSTELRDNDSFQDKLKGVITDQELSDIIGSAEETQSAQEDESDAQRQSDLDGANALIAQATTDAQSTADDQAFADGLSDNQDAVDEAAAAAGEDADTTTTTTSSSGGGSSSSGTTDTATQCVVTYYNGYVFAQLTVELSDTAVAVAPTLTPTENGNWYASTEIDATPYDFTTVLTESTLSLYWIGNDG